VVVRVLQEIEIKSLPDKIPHSFPVDLGKLEKVGNSIHVGDLNFSKEVKVMLPPETVIVTVTEKAREEVAAPPPAAEVPVAEATEAKEAEPAKEETPAGEKEKKQ